MVKLGHSWDRLKRFEQGVAQKRIGIRNAGDLDRVVDVGNNHGAGVIHEVDIGAEKAFVPGRKDQSDPCFGTAELLNFGIRESKRFNEMTVGS